MLGRAQSVHSRQNGGRTHRGRDGMVIAQGGSNTQRCSRNRCNILKLCTLREPLLCLVESHMTSGCLLPQLMFCTPYICRNCAMKLDLLSSIRSSYSLPTRGIEPPSLPPQLTSGEQIRMSDRRQDPIATAVKKGLYVVQPPFAFLFHNVYCSGDIL